MSSSLKFSQIAKRLSVRKTGTGNSYSNAAACTSMAWSSLPMDRRDERAPRKYPQSTTTGSTRSYHSTPRQEMVLYGTIILVATLSYVGYKKYHGEPLKPKSASDAQTAYQQMEEERLARNQRYQQQKPDERTR